MSTSFEHRALVEQLRALSQKRAANPSEKILNTSHPSGSDSAADDHTSPAVVGHRYAENSADNKEMYPAGTSSDHKAQAGSEQKDPGNNKGLHPRPSGEAPEVERKYNLNDHNDPGSSHPSGKSAEAFINEARSLAAEIRNLVKASSKGDTYVSGNAGDEAKDTSKKDAKGTAKYPVNSENHDNIPLSKEQGKDAAEKLAAIRYRATQELVEMRNGLKESAARDAESFVQSITMVMDKFAAPHVIPVIEQAEKQAHYQEKMAHEAAIHDVAEKIAMYDILAERDGMPKFSELMEGGTPDFKPAPKANKKPDADGDGVPDWADKKPGDDNAKSDEKVASILKKLAAQLEGKAGDSRKGPTFRKSAEEEVNEGEGHESEEEISADDEDAAEQALADMAAMPAGGGAPDEMMGGEMPVDPAMLAQEGGEAPLSPEEEAALMALMQQEGMKESDVRSYAKVSSLLAAGRLDASKLSKDQVSFLHACDGAVKRAGVKFATLRSASRLRNELNQIYKGINS